MTAELEGQIALVTGASRGIGRASALMLAHAGATVVLAARDELRLREVAKEIARAGGRSFSLKLELLDETSIHNLVQEIQTRFGRIDILVNNAGVTYSGKLEATPAADWDHVMAVNVRGPFLICREVIPIMRAQKSGRIINISSLVGVKGYALQTLYGASKHALRGMSIALAEELRPDNIRVHVICPGGVATEMITKVRPDIKTEELIEPREVAEMILYLASHRGNAVMDEVHLRRASSTPWF